MDSPVVEREDGELLADVGRVVDDADVRNGNVEVGEGEDVSPGAIMEHDGVSPAAVTSGEEMDLAVKKVKDRRESHGRRKRKDRENGGDDVESAEVKEERKKRKDEKSRHRRRDSGEGGEKRDHHRDRKESRRMKEKKVRKEDRHSRHKHDKHDRRREEAEEGREKVELKSIAVSLLEEEEEDGDSHRREDMDYDHQSRYSRSSRHGMRGEVSIPSPTGTDSRKYEISVPSPTRTDDRKYGFVLGSVVKPVMVDDEKEEGEILDDDSDLPVRVESDAESGEIHSSEMQTTRHIAGEADLNGVARSPSNSLRKTEVCRWDSPPAEAIKSTSENFTVDCNGLSSVKETTAKKSGRPLQATTTNALQSMLVIAEAYDSESPLSEEKDGLAFVLNAENRRRSSKNTENGSRRSELPELERKYGSAKAKTQENVLEKTELKTKQSMGPPEPRNVERKDREIEEVNMSSKVDDNQGITSLRNETRAGSNSEREDSKDQSIADKPKIKVTRHSVSPEPDSAQVGATRANHSRRRRSPSPRDDREKEKRNRSRSKERRGERGRSRSHDSVRRRDSSRKGSRSREPLRERSSIKVRSPSRETSIDRRAAVVESPKRRNRSRSRDSVAERRRSRDRLDSYDRRRRSRSRESLRMRYSARADSIDRRRRSRSRDSVKERSRYLSRRADSVERRRRSRSRSIRNRRADDRLTSRHADGRRRSRSRDRSRDREVDDRDRRLVDDTRHRSRDDRNRDDRSRDDRSSRDARQREGSRDNAYRDRDRDGKDRNRSNNDSQSKDSRNTLRESMAAEAMREEENQEEYQERVASQLAAQEEDDVDRIKEESRKRRQAILEKYKIQQQKPAVENPAVTDHGPTENGNTEKLSAAALESLQAEKQLSPLQAEKQLSPLQAEKQLSPQVSLPANVELSLGKTPTQNGTVPVPATSAGGLGEGSPKSERSADMFCDDIFGESPAGGRRLGRGDGLAMDTSGLIDNWDDAEGYYCFRIGEVLDGRYEVASSHGRGVFSTVVRARDMKAGRGEPEEVAIKIIRNNETMYKAGQQELVILKKLAGADPENKRHCVRLLSSFEYRSHLCLVFESLHMNLREILKKFGRNIGINLNAVRAYAKQLFISLKHLRNCGVLHCDIKPDNMLVNESKNVLKLCDFGSAMFAGENEITPYLVSRFYRAPEIILGLNYDHALDIWSVGCCLYELYTGKMLFPGGTNNDMLRLHMELKGAFPKKMLKKAAFADQHFDQDFNFCAMEEDPVTKKAIKRILVNIKPKDMGILVSGSGSADEDTKMLASFKDLLEKIFTLDPDKRLTVSQALSHSFISEPRAQ